MLVKENEFAALHDMDEWWVVEDKILLKLPIHHKTELTGGIFVETVITGVDKRGRGKVDFARFYYPKIDFPLSVAESAFNTIARANQRKVKKLEVLQEVLK